MEPMRLIALILVLPGCAFFGGDDGEDMCGYLPGTDYGAAPFRDPNTLQCVTIRPPDCPAECEMCPQTGAASVSWGSCGDPCEMHGQAECAADPACRVVTDARCEIQLNCLTNFVGCFPIDTQPNQSVDCFRADAQDCSRSNQCTALHSSNGCDPVSGSCESPFELCVPEGTSPGRCWDQVLCDAIGPECATDQTPGIANGCYTGACIPRHLCEPAP